MPVREDKAEAQNGDAAACLSLHGVRLHYTPDGKGKGSLDECCGSRSSLKLHGHLERKSGLGVRGPYFPSVCFHARQKGEDRARAEQGLIGPSTTGVGEGKSLIWES